MIDYFDKETRKTDFFYSINDSKNIDLWKAYQDLLLLPDCVT